MRCRLIAFLALLGQNAGVRVSKLGGGTEEGLSTSDPDEEEVDEFDDESWFGFDEDVTVNGPVEGIGHELCRNKETECKDHSSLLDKPCEDYHRCFELAGTEAAMLKFPDLNFVWCDETMQTIYRRKCSGDFFTPDTLFMDKLAKVVEIAEHELENPDDALPYVKKGHCAAAKDCLSCTDPENREGVLNFAVLSSACEWNSDENRCTVEVSEGIEQSKTVYHSEYCPIEEQGESFGQLNATRGTRLRALLVGYRYTGGRDELGGTVPDLVRIFAHLVKYQKYNASDIVIMTDDPDQLRHASDAGAIVYDAGCNGCGTTSSLKSVIEHTRRKIRTGDHFLWAYSGHGSFLEDQGGDELDGQDETIVTPSGEHYRDDDFYDFLSSLPAVRVSAISDACHNEGFSDLPFNYMSHDGTFCTDWRQPKSRLPTAKIMFLSGSQNHQTSADLGSGGALTLYAIGEDGFGGKWGVGAKDTVQNALLKEEKDFARRGITQIPNICSFPTFRESSQYTPYDVLAMANMHWDQAVGGHMPSDHHQMRVPSFCTHGASNDTNKNHKRFWTPRRSGVLDVDTRLDSAWTKPSTLPLEGWYEVTTTTTTTTTRESYKPVKPSFYAVVTDQKHGPRVDKLAVKPVRCSNGKTMCSGFRATEEGIVTVVKYGGSAWKAGLTTDDVIRHIRVSGSSVKRPWKHLTVSEKNSMTFGNFYLYVKRSFR
eukprot:TRINITY_DN5388_c0_g1_i1.p1 TRINITY_DN5388_c0_g1~~TRINITY_DN5388_c0_g1_i1.p1  ORF type:complete len:710 (+),score=115.87 TRINITY_DN5388_c0_g1_i1:96-2225(+)